MRSTNAVAWGVSSGRSTPRASMISHHRASLTAVNSSMGTPAAAAPSMILSSMSVMLDT